MSVDVQYRPNRQLFKINVCRLCSLIRDKVLPIFDNAGSKVDLKLKECFPNLNIKKDDSKPQYICIDCITKLNMFNEFLQVCIESECKFDNYVKQYLEEERIFRSALLQSSHENSGVWLEENTRTRERNSLKDDGVIVLSKIDSALRDPSVKNFVVMVELKYKSGPDISCNSLENNLNKNLSNESNINSADVRFQQARTFSEPSNLLDYNNHSSGGSIQGKERYNEPVNTNRAKDKKSYDCAICGRSFSRRTRLNSHISKHTAIKPHKCDKCEKAFSTRWDLTTHKRVHTEAFACSLCSKTFSSNSKLARHSRVHTGEKPYLCQECGKSFGEKRNLENHARAHSGDKPFACTVCSKSFGVRSHLKDHLSVHNKTARFNCISCSKSFKWKANYNRHIKTHGMAMGGDNCHSKLPD